MVANVIFSLFRPFCTNFALSPCDAFKIAASVENLVGFYWRYLDPPERVYAETAAVQSISARPLRALKNSQNDHLIKGSTFIEAKAVAVYWHAFHPKIYWHDYLFSGVIDNYIQKIS